MRHDGSHMPLPPTPVHRGYTPEQLRTRRLIGRTIQVAGVGAFVWIAYRNWTDMWGFPRSMAGRLSVGLLAVVLLGMHHWIPRQASILLDGDPPIKVTPGEPARSDRWYRRR
jgi:hypothetical protein